MYREWRRFIQSVHQPIPDAEFRQGDVKIWAGPVSKIETGWGLCDGRSLRRSSYPNLFTNIGTIHGSLDSEHFSIPNLTNLFIVGAKIDVSGIPESDIDTVSYYQAAGEITHYHNVSVNQHTHSISIYSNYHNHTFEVILDHSHHFAATLQTSSASVSDMDYGEVTIGLQGATAYHTHTVSVDTYTDTYHGSEIVTSDNVNIYLAGDTGSASYFSTDTQAAMPPWYTLCYIIKLY